MVAATTWQGTIVTREFIRSKTDVCIDSKKKKFVSISSWSVNAEGDEKHIVL